MSKLLGRYISEADPAHPRAKKRHGKLSKRSNMLRLQIRLASVVIVFNVVTLVWAVTRYDFNNRRIEGTLYTGNCTRIKSLSSVLHILLNIISSLFLGTGSYCMQILVAPSRAEIDRAHAMGMSLDIGVQSLRNIWNIQRRRAAVWWGLGAVSTILHFL